MLVFHATLFQFVEDFELSCCIVSESIECANEPIQFYAWENHRHLLSTIRFYHCVKKAFRKKSTKNKKIQKINLFNIISSSNITHYTFNIANFCWNMSLYIDSFEKKKNNWLYLFFLSMTKKINWSKNKTKKLTPGAIGIKTGRSKIELRWNKIKFKKTY